MRQDRADSAGHPLTPRIVILAILGSVLLIAGVIGGRQVLHQMWADAGRRSAQTEVRASARSAGAPEGILGARWLMTMDEVRRVRLDVQAGLKANELVEFLEMFGRQVAVAYVFDDDALLMVYVTFPAPSSEEEYDAARAEIVAKYGSLPEPKRRADGRWASTKQVGRIAISHDLYEQQGLMVQQLLIYRTRTPAP